MVQALWVRSGQKNAFWGSKQAICDSDSVTTALYSYPALPPFWWRGGLNWCGEQAIRVPAAHSVSSRIQQVFITCPTVSKDDWLRQKRGLCCSSGLWVLFIVDGVCLSNWKVKIISCQVVWQVGQTLRLGLLNKATAAGPATMYCQEAWVQCDWAC